MQQVDLILLHGSAPAYTWPLGNVRYVLATPQALSEFASAQLNEESAEFWLFWNLEQGDPQPDLISRLLSKPVDLWHGGLKLGMRGLPGIIDFVAPTWMLNLDPSANIDATSWRVSLNACLVRTDVLRQIGFIRPEFNSFEGACLEWGHRCISRGVLCRHQPELLSGTQKTTVFLPASDELRFVWSRFGKRWALWAIQRAVLSGYWNLRESMRAWQAVSSDSPIRQTPVYRHPTDERVESPGVDGRVSVLIPTIGRYPYLQKLLTQLRQQTMPAHEIIIVDQTPQSHRRLDVYAAFRDLPIKILYQEKPGQSSARNAGLNVMRGEYILFLDDDDEVPADLIEKHLLNLQRFDADVSSGVANEIGAGALPEAFTLLRLSDVFPTNNSMVRRSALQKSGLFDLAFDYGPRADADLGMRLYLSGARAILNPMIRILHHHASHGGLRTHKARVITYARSRKSLAHRNLPEATELYLALRYFTQTQLRESLWLRALGTLSLHGSSLRQLMKFILGLAMMPDTWRQIRNRMKQAQALFQVFPQIPSLAEERQPITDATYAR
jgi:glycosyltransferase involved in cell wall biosynthesis